MNGAVIRRWIKIAAALVADRWFVVADDVLWNMNEVFRIAF